MKKCFLLLALLTMAGLNSFAQSASRTQQPAVPSATTSVNSVQDDPVLMTIGTTEVRLSEFLYVYQKNNKDQTNDPKALDSYIDLFTTFKMKVLEAEEMQMDTSVAFKTELAGYRRQVAQPYLTDRKVNDSLLMEAYSRMQEDIRASHILIRVDENALPADTDIAYTRAMIIQGLLNGKCTPKMITDYELKLKTRNNITKTSTAADTMKIYNLVNPLRVLEKKYHNKPAPFDEVAYSASQDETARQNRGDLGYFTAFSMVYPFETLAYKTPVGKTGGPVRTRFGYHFIHVTDRRPAMGEILVAHIMIKAPDGMPAADSIAAKAKADEIYGKVKAGEDFATLAKQFSDDKTSGVNGGQLPWFGLYKMPATFERAAFALQNNGDVCEPVKTAWGWHIIKRIDKRGIAPFEQLKSDLKNRVSRDSRAMQGRSALIAQVKVDYKFKENIGAKIEFYKAIDSTLYLGRWIPSEHVKTMNKVMFTLGTTNYTQADFATYLVTHQVKQAKADNKTLIDAAYKEFVDEACVNYEDSMLETKYQDFRYLMNEYRDGILLFDLMDKKVWSKAVKDTVGLRQFYDQNKTKYMWDERAEATIWSCKDAATAKALHKLLKKGKDEKTILATLNKTSQLNVTADHKIWNKKENQMVDDNWKEGTSADMIKDGRVVFVVTQQIIPPTPKTLQEARGMITSDYQAQLEKDWVDSLKKKYKVVINQDVLNSIKNPK
ncbi:MAG TPA: peptidylprolyl isomerase [Bacteroidia bacterium]|nr:peptidylprolyl isomerase [Bacteroidia bacterium]